MMRPFILLPFFLLILSCDTNEDAVVQQPETDNFYALNVGNSWVYKYYSGVTNENPVGIDTGVIDSVKIISTEEYNGHIYYKFRSIVSGINPSANPIPWRENGESFKLMRDSLGYLIDDTGHVEFVSDSYNEIFIDEYDFHKTFAQLMPETVVFESEGIEFECKKMLLLHRRLDDNSQLPFINEYYYSNGIGLISDDVGFISSNDSRYQRRLVSYSVE